ncbi:hypothetical protein ACFWG6_31125 [Streptomyces erythrochromogenes]|uniref:hypothetical protein n=1 Tax=Streptomyces erythrochromogenes TaxID=285574 RepID=UPI00362A4EC7
MTAVQPTLDGTIPPPARPRASDYQTWVEKVRPVFEEIARTGRRFTSYEIADERKLEDPPLPKTHWGSFIHRLAEDGLIEHVAFDETERPGGNHSVVKVWRGTRAARQGRAA